MSEKIAFVDVDNTLWDFEAVMRSKMAELLTVEIPESFAEWNQPVDMFEDKQLAYDMFNDIHMNQEQYSPFGSADRVLKDLRRLGYDILIASNRIKESQPQLEKWLDANWLIYNDIYCGLNKEELLANPDIELVVDDSPFIINEAMKRDIPVLSLRYRYNKNILGNKKFNTLQEMHEHLIQELIGKI